VTNNGKLDDAKMEEWLRFMFEIEPIAARLHDYCRRFEIPDSQMYQLIALGFMSQNTARRTEEWLKANVVAEVV